MAITTEVIEDIQQLTASNVTSSLFTHSELPSSLCTTADWLTNWLSHYLTPQDRLFVCCHRLGGKFIAIYPLYLKKITLGFELRFIGTGEPEHAEVCSEFQDFMIHPDHLQESLSLFTEQVKQLKRCYSICFENVLPHSHCYQWLKNYRVTGWHCHDRVIGEHYLLPVALSEQQQIEQLLQSTLRRYARRYVERNDIAIEYCTNNDDIPLFFDSLIQLHNMQWQKRGKPGAFSSSQFRQFHLDLAQSMLQQNKLLLFKLIHDSQVIAVFYGFYQGTTLYYYQSGISADSPLPNTGIAMHLVAMRHARKNNCNFYDLMKGSPHSYKKGIITPKHTVITLNNTHLFLAASRLLAVLASKVSKKVHLNFK